MISDYYSYYAYTGLHECWILVFGHIPGQLRVLSDPILGVLCIIHSSDAEKFTYSI